MKINKNNKLKKEMEKKNQKQKENQKQKLLTTKRSPMAFVVAQNRKSLRLITPKQKQKHNVNTTNDK